MKNKHDSEAAIKDDGRVISAIPLVSHRPTAQRFLLFAEADRARAEAARSREGEMNENVPSNDLQNIAASRSKPQAKAHGACHNHEIKLFVTRRSHSKLKSRISGFYMLLLLTPGY